MRRMSSFGTERPCRSIHSPGSEKRSGAGSASSFGIELAGSSGGESLGKSARRSGDAPARDSDAQAAIVEDAVIGRRHRVQAMQIYPRFPQDKDLGGQFDRNGPRFADLKKPNAEVIEKDFQRLQPAADPVRHHLQREKVRAEWPAQEHLDDALAAADPSEFLLGLVPPFGVVKRLRIRRRADYVLAGNIDRGAAGIVATRRSHGRGWKRSSGFLRRRQPPDRAKRRAQFCL